MEAPSPKAIVEATGISPSYASMILSDSDDPAKHRVPPRSLAILIYRRTGWKHSSIAELTEAQMQVFEEVDPWTPKAAA
jgi:hypothetical protein